MTMGTIERLHAHRDEILRLATEFGARNVRLLGLTVDVVAEDGLHWFIRDRVLADARPLP